MAGVAPMAMGVESLVALTTSNIIDEAKQGARSSTESEMASSNSVLISY